MTELNGWGGTGRRNQNEIPGPGDDCNYCAYVDAVDTVTQER